MDAANGIDFVGYKVGPVVAERYKVVSQSAAYAFPFCSCRAIDLVHSAEVHLDIHLKHQRGAVALRREFAALRLLRHPSIVKAHEFLENEHVVVFANEWFEAQSLASLIRSQPPDVADALAIVAELASALAHAHGHCVVHQALTPRCIYVQNCHNTPFAPRLHVRGFDRIEPRRLKDNIGCATPFLDEIHYAAPETFFSNKQACSRTDIYAIGVIAFELLTRRLPFQSRVPLELMNLYCHAKVPRLSKLVDVPTWVDELIESCLSKSPEDRPVAAEIVRFIESEGRIRPATSRPGAISRLRRVWKTRDTRSAYSRTIRNAFKTKWLWER